jgi:phosphoglycolate phosphatase
MPPLAVLFDLDGTLVQTREASWKIFERINAAFQLGVATQEDYFRLLEDNLFQGLRRLCRDEAHAKEVAQRFLAELEANYRPDFVPGIADVIRALAANCSLAVVSSNSTATIRRLLANAGFAHCFSHVFGGDVEPDKRAVVRRFLADDSYLVSRHCSPAYREGGQPAHATSKDLVLVTDTTGDVKHARECGVRAIGVAWGMHREKDLLAAGAEFVAIWPQEILSRLLPGGARAACDAPPKSAACCEASPGEPCSCDDRALADAGAVRRSRNRMRVETLEARLAIKTPQAAAVPRSAFTANASLMRSLARLRAAPMRV